MTTTKRTIVIVGSILAVLIVAGLALPAVGRLIQSTETDHHALPGQLSSLTLEGEVGDITVRAAGPGEAPSAQATIRSGLTSPHVDALVEGDAAMLSDSCDNTWWDNCSVSWSLVVQDDTALTLASSVGNITVTDAAGPLSISSSVGDISATGITSPTVTTTSSVGSVTLHLVAPPQQVRASTSTGDVTITVPDDGTGYRVETDSSIGSITNQVGSDPAESRDIDVSTSVGDITLRRG